MESHLWCFKTLSDYVPHNCYQRKDFVRVWAVLQNDEMMLYEAFDLATQTPNRFLYKVSLKDCTILQSVEPFMCNGISVTSVAGSLSIFDCDSRSLQGAWIEAMTLASKFSFQRDNRLAEINEWLRDLGLKFNDLKYKSAITGAFRQRYFCRRTSFKIISDDIRVYILSSGHCYHIPTKLVVMVHCSRSLKMRSWSCWTFTFK